MRISYEEKISFSNQAKELTPPQLADLVKLVKEVAPNAFREIDKDNVQILVDNIDFQGYNTINK